MTATRIAHIFAGFMVLLALALGATESPLYVSNYFLWIAVYVGFSLFQSGFTCFCPLEKLLKKTGCCRE